MTSRRAGVLFLAAQAVGGTAWWAALLLWPESRAPFKTAAAPDTTLLAFGPADLLLYVMASAACAVGLSSCARWAWPLLCAHAGAAAYAGLYCWGLVAVTGGDGLLGAALMSPSLVVPGWLAWRTRPGFPVRMSP